MSGKSNAISALTTTVARLSGKPATFVLAVSLTGMWAISGPFLGFSESWQLVFNTSTTIITFLMVFVRQNSQNRDGRTLQAKLDELILMSQAQNKFVGIEKLDGESLRRMSMRLADRRDCFEPVADVVAQRGQDNHDQFERYDRCFAL
jgi:low affinity Fe/Cu permease